MDRETSDIAWWLILFALCAVLAVALSGFSGPIEQGWCERNRCTTITTDEGICPPGSLPDGRRCVFLSDGE